MPSCASTKQNNGTGCSTTLGQTKVLRNENVKIQFRSPFNETHDTCAAFIQGQATYVCNMCFIFSKKIKRRSTMRLHSNSRDTGALQTTNQAANQLAARLGFC